MTNIKLTKRKKGLSDRVRPDSEAAPWVIEEIRALEEENQRLQEQIVSFEEDEEKFLNEHDENVRLHFENVDLKEQNARLREALNFIVNNASSWGLEAEEYVQRARAAFEVRE